MAIELKINGVLRPINSTDETHEDIYGKGGFMTVDDTDALNAIPSTRRKVGMFVQVTSDGEVFRWTGVDWSKDLALNILSSGSSVTNFWDVFEAGAGIIPTASDNSKLANIPEFDSAGYRSESFFLRKAEYLSNEAITPIKGTVYNVIDSYADILALPVSSEYADVLSGTVYYAKIENTEYQIDTVPTSIRASGYSDSAGGDGTVATDYIWDELGDESWVNPNDWTLYLDYGDEYIWYARDPLDTRIYYVVAEIENDGTEFPPKTGWLKVSDDLPAPSSVAYDDNTWKVFTPETEYLTETEIDTDYLKKVDASSTYLTETEIDTDYLKKVDASSTYLTETEIDTDYLKKTDASSTYVAIDGGLVGIPASSSADGVKGQYVFDLGNGFRYDCVTTGTGGSGVWVQTAIVTTF